MITCFAPNNNLEELLFVDNIKENTLQKCNLLVLWAGNDKGKEIQNSMRISSLEEYGLRCLLALAGKGESGQLSISEIAELEGLSVPYASKLLAILRKAELVKSVRGRKGGFCIARAPKEINLYQVITALGGPLIDPDHCSKHAGQLEECIHTADCSVQMLLGGLAGYLGEYLVKTTLVDLMDGGNHLHPVTLAPKFNVPVETVLTEEPSSMAKPSSINERP